MDDISKKYAKQIYEIAKRIEVSRELLSDIAYDINKHENTTNEDLRLDIDKWTATIKNNIIHLYIPDMPAKIKEVKNIYRNRWKRNTIEALMKLGPNIPNYESIFVLIKLYRPNTNWDIDNVDIKPIIDGIRFSKIIKDDTAEYLSYGVMPIKSDNPHIEILIFDNKFFQELTKKIDEMYTEI